MPERKSTRRVSCDDSCQLKQMIIEFLYVAPVNMRIEDRYEKHARYRECSTDTDDCAQQKAKPQ